jgi:carbon-monoxide dehydrogenase large subunit
VNIVHGDTDKVQFGMGTYGSRSGAVGMSAIAKAIDKVIAKGKKVAAHVLEPRGRHRVQGRQVLGGRHRPRSASARARSRPTSPTSSPGQELEPGLKEGAFYDPPTSPSRRASTSASWRSTRHGRHHHRALDGGGRLRVVINPMIVEGQVHGGIAQGSARRCSRAPTTTTRASS